MSSIVIPRLMGYAVIMVRKVRLCGKTKAIHAMRTPQTPSTVSTAGVREMPKVFKLKMLKNSCFLLPILV